MIDNENEIFETVQDFLSRSCAAYSDQVAKQNRDLDSFNGNFWCDDVKKAYKRTSKRKFCLHFSDWSVLANAISSPFSNSPWHIELLSRIGANDEVQNTINGLEQENDVKFELKKAFSRAVVAGAGFAVVTTDVDEQGQPKIVIEFVQNQSSVALDPNIQKVDGSDAEEGAIVNYMSIKKAKRLFGDDILPFDYPRAIPKLSFMNSAQWPVQENQIQVVSYYTKNENGFVDYYKLCGNKILDKIELPIKYIPIIRFAGYEQYTSDGVKYTGIVDKTWTLQLGLNIAYSTLMERANRSIKANLIASTNSVKNLDTYYRKKEDEDGSMILYNDGCPAPIPLTEQFQTADLQAVIQTSREAIADVIGIPLAGILGAEDKTATEILIQQTNKESNVAVFYDNAYKANRTIGRIIVELLNNGSDIQFELENGPDVITNNLKHRQELNAIANLMPAEMQPLVAIHMCDTIDSSFVEGIKRDIIANCDANIKLTTEAEDPVAIHQMKQMQNIIDSSMQQIDTMTAELEQLKQQNAQLSLALNNSKEKNLIELQKHQDSVALQAAKLELEAQKQNVDIELDVADKQSELAKEAVEIENKKLDLLQDAMIGG